MLHEKYGIISKEKGEVYPIQVPEEAKGGDWVRKRRIAGITGPGRGKERGRIEDAEEGGGRGKGCKKHSFFAWECVVI